MRRTTVLHRRLNRSGWIDRRGCERWPLCGLLVCMLLATPGRASAQAAWTLTTADFKSRAVNLLALDDAGVKVSEQGGSESVVPWHGVLQLERGSAADAPAPAKPDAVAAKFTLYLANGDRIAGAAESLAGEILAWRSSAAGNVDAKLKQVVAIARVSEPPPRRDAQRTEDVVLLTNGDAARGLIAAIDNAGITVQVEGNAVIVPWDSVRTVLLAAVPATATGPATDKRGVRVTLADGSILSGSTISMSGDTAMLAAADAQRELAASAVVAIEQVNGPVAWLSSLQPAESVQTPFLETVFPARMDRTVRGEPIRFADRTFPRGIGVHSYSRLVWTLPEGGRYKAFRAQYAIDGDKPYANVTVRVKLDNKVVHEQPDFVAGKLSDVVQIPLADAKMLTLEVDYGKTYDVQDRFNWIEPALLAK